MLVLGARGTTGYVLSRGARSAAQWWMAAGVTPVAAYQPKGAASLAASYVNLANPGTYNAAPISAPSGIGWAADEGWIFAALYNQALEIGIVPTSLNWTMIARVSALVAGRIAGAFNGTTQCIGLDANGGASAWQPRNSTIVTGWTGGVMAVSAQKFYLDSVERATINATGSVTTNTIRIGVFNGTGPFFNGKISSLWIGNATLDAAAVAAQSAAMP